MPSSIEEQARKSILKVIAHSEDTIYKVITYCTPSFYTTLIRHPCMITLYRINERLESITTSGRVVAFAARYKKRKVWNVYDNTGFLVRVSRKERLTERFTLIVEESYNV